MQEDIIRSVISGKDTLALLPTGGGKSICFQVPALLQEKLCIVISPLIALMKDQVEALQQRGIPAAAIYSGMPYREIQQILDDALTNEIRFIYLSPERIQTRQFQQFLSNARPGILAVDEAHCISQWGYDFRPAYLRIREMREWLPGVPILALTASATQRVQEDICNSLGFETKNIFRQSFHRPNLSYEVYRTESKQAFLTQLLNKHPGCGIVYCRSRQQTVKLAALLNLHHISADYYHAGLNTIERNQKQDNWLKDKTRIMVCTNAFGMGIDKPNVRIVVHADTPDCLENYYQEAGRAGRDGKPSSAILLTDNSEWELLTEQAAIRFPDNETLKKVYLSLMDFMQIPVGAGEGECRDFDINTFSTNFQLKPTEAFYGIKALAQCGILHFNENFSRPSTVTITASRNDLNEYEKTHPQFTETIKGLLRSYEGILDGPVNIREQSLAYFLRIKENELTNNLQALHNSGIIKYSSKSEKPMIVLLKNRMFRNHLYFNRETLNTLKETYLTRLQAMKSYAENLVTCRSKLIATYFDAGFETDCNICDNCKKRADILLTSDMFALITEKVLHTLSINKPTPYSQLKEIASEENIKKVLKYLYEEQKIRADIRGNLFLSK